MDDKQIIEFNLQFLMRVELKGSEVEAFNTVINYLTNKTKDNDLKETNK